MPELNFNIEGAEAVPYSATPLLHLKLRIACARSQIQIHNILLQCQIQIEPGRRRYLPEEQEQDKLRDLFGAPARWSQTLRPVLWANASVVVPTFQETTLANLPLPCTFDFAVAAAKYMYGLEDGYAPLCVLFSGTVFYANEEGALQVAKISWDRESNYRLPVSVWKDAIDMHYPNTAWLSLQRQVFDQLYRYKVARGIPTFEQALENIMTAAEENDLRKARV